MIHVHFLKRHKEPAVARHMEEAGRIEEKYRGCGKVFRSAGSFSCSTGACRALAGLYRIMGEGRVQA